MFTEFQIELLKIIVEAKTFEELKQNLMNKCIGRLEEEHYQHTLHQDTITNNSQTIPGNAQTLPGEDQTVPGEIHIENQIQQLIQIRETLGQLNKESQQ